MIDYAILYLYNYIYNFSYCFLGVLWPLEGLPRGIRWVSNLMPVTYAVIAVKAVVSKGNYIVNIIV